ncbi:hypothetical protein [Algoriphagus sp. NG3]|uniref:hypothetical protein n=1 Tax=Algoriphagus sp. NG3 TaxID=3097546 RepID=UPI002A82560E|nr:hypothetical protein [Algoriphagus sp. NG3]WPR75222.1 hypothetical protein SLW71_21405 [Algoriphagus sp. NG3]
MFDLKEYNLIKDFIKQKSVLLMKHDKKNFARVGISINNYGVLENDGIKYYVISTNIFKSLILEGKLIDACLIYPNKFGTGNAKDVVDAIWILNPWCDLDHFIELLRDEQFCYVMEVKDGHITNKLLRIDLYRHIKENNSGGFDFIGGIFHCYKHFSYKGLPLSSGKEINNIDHPKQLVIKVIQAFFYGQDIMVTDDTFKSEIKIGEEAKIRLVYYFEKNTEIYFIKTAHRV